MASSLITEKAIERLSSRVKTVSNLYNRGIVSGTILRKQIKSILNNSDSRTVYKELIEPNRKALRIIYRIENPNGWRKTFTAATTEREEAFYILVEEILTKNNSQTEKILSILETVSLPFYSGFFPKLFTDKNEQKQVKTSRVSVLD